MANEHKIEINKRENTGKKGVKILRREGSIPGIYYSPTSKDSTPIVITKHEYNAAIKSGARIFNISVGNKKQTVLMKSIQYHPITDDILHIDLYGIRMDKPVNIKIVINLLGDPLGVIEEGGLLNQPTNEIEISCLPGDIPEYFEKDISKLKLGESINVGSINLEEKYTLLTSEDMVLASITQPMQEVETVLDEGDESFMDEEGETTTESKDGSSDENTSKEQDTESD